MPEEELDQERELDEQPTRELEQPGSDQAPPAPAAHTVPDPIRHNDRVFIQGKTESGKTVLAGHLFSMFTGCRRTIIDVKGRLNAGVEPARSAEELDLAAPVSHFIPGSLDEKVYEDVFQRLWHAGGPRVIWLDESYGPTRKGYAPEGLRLIVQQGREHDIGLLACSQRPVNVEVTLVSEAEHVFIFVPRPMRKDLETLAANIGIETEELGRELNELLAQEGEHSHLWYCRRQDQLYRCAPLPAEWAA
jgi:hypothetical protein